MPRLLAYTFQGRSLVREVFIETGTYEGETLAVAAAAGFHECHSIEVHVGHYRRAVARFVGQPWVRLHCGSSPDVLPAIMDPAKTTTFWLDGHYQNCLPDEIDPRRGQCPLLSELAVITAVPWVYPPIVLVDDARMFRHPWPAELRRWFDEAQWPSVEQIAGLLPGHRLTEQDDILYFLPADLNRGDRPS